MTWKKLAALTEHKFVGAYGIQYWAIREGKVWHQGRKLAAADPQTFEFCEEQYFLGRDASCIYHAWSRLPKIDRDSFRRVGLYWMDRQHVYFEYETSFKALRDVDPGSFRHVGGSYGADDHSAWYYGRKMSGNPRCMDLRVIAENDLYACDGEAVYYDGKPLKGVLAAQWRILTEEFSGDGKNLYFTERKLARADFATWRHVHGAWSKDQHRVFHMNLVMKDLAPEGFDETQARQLSS